MQSGNTIYLIMLWYGKTGLRTTRLHIVSNASAKCDGSSLNECLHKGPKFFLDLLLRFRIALTADVEKAPLMIAIDDNDRDVLRFIWIDDITKHEPVLRVFRFTRVVFGVSSSPFLLNATIKFHLECYLESNEEIVRRLLQSTYVDNIVMGADSEEPLCTSKGPVSTGRIQSQKVFDQF